MYTPWGKSDGSSVLATGIVSYDTERHGGWHLSRKRTAQLWSVGVRYQDSFLYDLRWWEEDCDYAVPLLVFAKDINAAGNVNVEKMRRAVVTMYDYKPELFALLQANGTFKDAEAIMGETVTSIIERERGAQ